MTEDEQDLTFETALSGLERIVNELERGDLDLSASLARYETGVALLGRCQRLLDGVDRSVALLTGVEADGAAIVAPFDGAATVAAEPPRPPARAARTKKPKPVEPEPEPDGLVNGGLDFDPPF